MTDAKKRLCEIKFYELVNRFVRTTHDPYQLYDFIDVMGAMFGCNRLHLREAVRVTVQDNTYLKAPTVEETAVLLYLNGNPPNQIYTRLQVSRSVYYHYINKYKAGEIDISTTYSEKLLTEIITIITNLENMLAIIR